MKKKFKTYLEIMEGNMMSNNFSREKCDTNDNQNKSVNPWTRDEKRSPTIEKVENKCNHLILRKDWHSFRYSFDVQFLSYQVSTFFDKYYYLEIYQEVIASRFNDLYLFLNWDVLVTWKIEKAINCWRKRADRIWTTVLTTLYSVSR